MLSGLKILLSVPLTILCLNSALISANSISLTPFTSSKTAMARKTWCTASATWTNLIPISISASFRLQQTDDYPHAMFSIPKHLKNYRRIFTLQLPNITGLNAAIIMRVTTSNSICSKFNRQSKKLFNTLMTFIHITAHKPISKKLTLTPTTPLPALLLSPKTKTTSNYLLPISPNLAKLLKRALRLLLLLIFFKNKISNYNAKNQKPFLTTIIFFINWTNWKQKHQTTRLSLNFGANTLTAPLPNFKKLSLVIAMTSIGLLSAFSLLLTAASTKLQQLCVTHFKRLAFLTLKHIFLTFWKPQKNNLQKILLLTHLLTRLRGIPLNLQRQTTVNLVILKP